MINIWTWGRYHLFEEWGEVGSEALTGAQAPWWGTWSREMKEAAESKDSEWGPCRGWEGRAQLMFRFLCVTMDDNPDMWAQEERAWKTRFYNQVGHLQVCSTSPCVDALQIFFRRIGIYLYFLNEEIERSESVRNLPELWVRPGVCYHTFITFLSVSNGENSFTGKSMIQFHDLKFPWKG